MGLWAHCLQDTGFRRLGCNRILFQVLTCVLTKAIIEFDHGYGYSDRIQIHSALAHTARSVDMHLGGGFFTIPMRIRIPGNRIEQDFRRSRDLRLDNECRRI